MRAPEMAAYGVKKPVSLGEVGIALEEATH